MADKAETKVLKLTDWEDSICAVIRARQPGLVIQTTEERRALQALENIILWMAMNKCGNREIMVWSNVSFKSINVLEKYSDPNTPYVPKELKPEELITVLKTFGNDTGTDQQPRMATLVLTDINGIFTDPSKEKSVRMLRETLWKIRGTFRNIVLIGCAYDLPQHIAVDFSLQRFELPTAKDMQTILTPQINAFRNAPQYKNLVKIDDEEVHRFSRACAGLTEAEARSLLSLAIAKFQALDVRAINMALQEKARIVERSNGVLEYKTITGGLDRVGGLDNAKSWIRELDDNVKNEAETLAYGEEMPQGCILLGIPGCGKSYIAEMLAAHWGLPLLVFNVARAFGGIIGQSEANIDQVIALSKACAPAVILIDEVEKAIGGGGDLDGGTTERVKGKLLTWLQQKAPGLFIVATANDITKFDKSPEFLRAGRFDKIFFVDLPDMRSRIEILTIHYKLAVERAKAAGQCKLAEDIPQEVLIEGAKATKAYSGAELKVVLQNALRLTRMKKATHPTAEMMVKAAAAQKPLSFTMKESVAGLRAWVKDGRALPAGATLEDDKSDAKAFEEFGLPQLLVDHK